MSIAATERRWLDYAWRVVTWPTTHSRPCLSAGAAPHAPTPAWRHNDLRWPGYIGRNYIEASGILCVGAVSRGGATFKSSLNAWAYDALGTAIREWAAHGRDTTSDRAFLEAQRHIHERSFPHWSRWRQVYRTFVEDHMGMDCTHIAWGNLAKCRAENVDTQRLARVCQSVFPAREMVAALRPAVVLVCVVNANAGGGIVDGWQAGDADPLVWTFEGRNARDREGRPFRQWGPELAGRVQTIMQSRRDEAQE